jgi:hypothetical protein
MLSRSFSCDRKQYDTQHNNKYNATLSIVVEFCYAECNLSQVSRMLRAVYKPSMLSVFMLSVVTLSLIILSVAFYLFVKLSVVISNFIILSVAFYLLLCSVS